MISCNRQRRNSVVPSAVIFTWSTTALLAVTVLMLLVVVVSQAPSTHAFDFEPRATNQFAPAQALLLTPFINDNVIDDNAGFLSGMSPLGGGGSSSGGSRRRLLQPPPLKKRSAAPVPLRANRRELLAEDWW
jgi:hypothetical protein